MLRRLTLLTALLTVALPAAAAFALPVPGVNLAGTSDAELDDAAAGGARVARLFVPWPAVEPARGSWAAGVLDGYAGDAVRMHRRGIRPIFVLLQSPAWASGSSDPLAPPRDPADYAAFARRFAQRMHDALAPAGGQVAGYEIWNEPDEAQFWHGGPEPARYAALLERAYPAIKAADPRASVVLGPTTGNDYAWLQQLYDRGARGSFDAVAVHTDTACLDRGPDSFYRDGGRIARFTFLGYREMHATMVAHGDGAKPIWMTELGWSANSLTCARGRWAGQKPAGVSEADQAAYLRQAFHCMASDPYLQYALWFNHRDLGASETELNRYGLLRSDGSHRPAWDAFRSVATQGDTLSGSCGDFSGPQVAIVRPATGQRYSERLPIAARVGDAGGVRRVTFLADGKRIRGFAPDGPQPYAMRWLGSRELSFGPHTITVSAEDINGNVGSASVQVVHVRPRPKATRRTRVRAKVSVAGLQATVSGRVLGRGRGRPEGRVRVVWQWAPDGASAATGPAAAWQSLHAATAGVRRSFRLRQQLARAGSWRVRVRYAGRPPYRRSASRWTYFVAG